jgi:hypothetical protein
MKIQTAWEIWPLINRLSVLLVEKDGRQRQKKELTPPFSLSPPPRVAFGRAKARQRPP